MDIISQENFTLLRLCGDEAVLPYKGFVQLIETACQTILLPDKNQNESVIATIPCSNKDILKQCFAAVMTLIVELAKSDIEDEQLEIVLDDCQFSHNRKESFVSTFNHFRSDLRSHLSIIGNCLPDLVDVQWRLDYGVKNSHIHKVNELRYSVALKQNNGKNVNFTCTREELQDLVGKLKEATKALERASQV